jgi:hypothetical protein
MISKIIMIPKDKSILDPYNSGFLPPQAYFEKRYSDLPAKWCRYYPDSQIDSNFHTFGLIFAWDGKPEYSGLDFFWRRYSSLPFEWPLINGKGNYAKNIISKFNNFGMKPDTYGTLVVVDVEDKELSPDTLRPIGA